jgi:hypothetical protein
MFGEENLFSVVPHNSAVIDQSGILFENKALLASMVALGASEPGA